MKREVKIITERGSYEFGNNYELIFKNSNDFYLDYCNDFYLDYCNIICGDNCYIVCGHNCTITCGNDCKIICGDDCGIKCENNCIIQAGYYCQIICGKNCSLDSESTKYFFVKGGEGTILGYFQKTITKNEENIWWYDNCNRKLINTFENQKWKNDNVDKWNEFYGFVHNELNSVTLF